MSEIQPPSTFDDAIEIIPRQWELVGLKKGPKSEGHGGWSATLRLRDEFIAVGPECFVDSGQVFETNERSPIAAIYSAAMKAQKIEAIAKERKSQLANDRSSSDYC